MAKLELHFLDSDNKEDYVKVNAYSIDSDETFDEIKITLKEDGFSKTVYLDKSTAIKFAKTLRTEINKII